MNVGSTTFFERPGGVVEASTVASSSANRFTVSFTQQSFGWDLREHGPHALRVDFVEPDGEAVGQGVTTGNVVVAVNDIAVSDYLSFVAAVQARGRPVQLTLEEQIHKEVIIKFMQSASELETEIDLRPHQEENSERKDSLLDLKKLGLHMNTLSPEFAVRIISTSKSKGCRSRWIDDLKKQHFDPNTAWPVDKQFRKGGFIVTAAPQSTLAIALLKERFDLYKSLTILIKLARCLQHLHSKNYVHTDVHPSNVVRMADGTWKLNDFKACVRTATPISHEASRACCPPETTIEYAQAPGVIILKIPELDDDDTEKHLGRAAGLGTESNGDSNSSEGENEEERDKEVEWGNVINAVKVKEDLHREREIESMKFPNALKSKLSRKSLGNLFLDALSAEPSFDVWSFGVLFFQMLVHRPLFTSSSSNKLPPPPELQRLHRWSHKDVADAMYELNEALTSGMDAEAQEPDNILAASELLGKILERLRRYATACITRAASQDGCYSPRRKIRKDRKPDPIL